MAVPMTQQHPSPVTEHTPTPWEAQSFGDGEDGIGILGSDLGGLVAWATLFPTEIAANDHSRAQANAAFIVKAVNNHDVLVAALREIEDLGANGATAARLSNIANAALSRLPQATETNPTTEK